MAVFVVVGSEIGLTDDGIVGAAVNLESKRAYVVFRGKRLCVVLTVVPVEIEFERYSLSYLFFGFRQHPTGKHEVGIDLVAECDLIR